MKLSEKLLKMGMKIKVGEKVYEYDYSNIIFKTEVLEAFKKKARNEKITNTELLKRLLDKDEVKK